MGLKEDMQNEMENIKGDLATVSKAFHELKTEKDGAKIRHRNISIVILSILLIVSNLAWLIYRTSLEKVVETTTTTETYTINQEAEGTNNSIINGGDIVNGKAND